MLSDDGDAAEDVAAGCPVEEGTVYAIVEDARAGGPPWATTALVVGSCGCVVVVV